MLKATALQQPSRRITTVPVLVCLRSPRLACSNSNDKQTGDLFSTYLYRAGVLLAAPVLEVDHALFLVRGAEARLSPNIAEPRRHRATFLLAWLVFVRESRTRTDGSGRGRERHAPSKN